MTEKKWERMPYPFKTKPYAHQLACWDMSKDKEAFALFMDMGCLAGESEVRLNGLDGKISLGELFERGLDRFSETASLGQDLFELNGIRAVLDSGRKRVVELSMRSGRSLVLTPDHEVGTTAGWTRVDSLSQDHEVLSSCGGMIPTIDCIKGVSRSWVHRTFDLVMEDPNRNFIGNGIVVSNCGKSKVLVDTAAYQYDVGKINGLLVVAPKGCFQDWFFDHIPIHMPEHVKYEMALWNPDPSKKEVKELQKLFKANEDLQILVMNVEAFTTKKGTRFAEQFLLGHRALMVIDESTSIKHGTSARTKNIVSMRKFATTRRIMTGDPTANSPLDIYSQCLFLDPHLLGFDSFYTFKSRYANLLRTNLGGRTFMKITGYRDLDDLNKQIKTFSFIVKKDECLDLPEKVYQVRKVKMGPKQQKAYDEMRQLSMTILEEQIGQRESMAGADEGNLFEEYVANVDKCPSCGCPGRNFLCRDRFHSDELPPILTATEAKVPNVSTADLVLTQLGKLHQIVCGFIKTDDGVVHEFDERDERLETLLEVLEELPKAVIWATYRHTIFKLEAEIKKKFGEESVLTYFGDTTLDERQVAKTKFKDLDSKVRFFLSNPATGKFGLTLISASTAIYYSNSYDGEERAQSEDRIHRIGQTKKCNIVDIICPKSVDEKILNVLKSKRKISAEITRSNWREWI